MPRGRKKAEPKLKLRDGRYIIERSKTVKKETVVTLLHQGHDLCDALGLMKKMQPKVELSRLEKGEKGTLVRVLLAFRTGLPSPVAPRRRVSF